MACFHFDGFAVGGGPDPDLTPPRRSKPPREWTVEVVAGKDELWTEWPMHWIVPAADALHWTIQTLTGRREGDIAPHELARGLPLNPPLAVRKGERCRLTVALVRSKDDRDEN